MLDEKRRIGPFEVGPIGLGCMGMSEFYGPRDDKESAETLERAVAIGVTHFDTADMYGHGHNEALLAPLIRRHAGRITVATKFGIVRPRGGGYDRRIDNSPAYIASACDASLRRLGVEAIDLYYVHRLDAGQPVEETVEGLSRLVEQGKVRAVGLCEPSEGTLRRAHAVHPVAAVQSEFSLWSRDPEADGVLDATRDLGAAFVAYCPVGRGFLSGAITGRSELAGGDMRLALPRFANENLAHNLTIVDSVRELAMSKGCTLAQIAIAWLLNRADHIVPIPGTRRINHLEQNTAASRVSLSAQEATRLSDAISAQAPHGDRYTLEGMKGVGV